MSTTLDATVGGAAANTYNTEAELDAAADAAFPVPTCWTDADTEDRRRAAVAATVRLDRMRYVGEVVDDDQALAWPRFGAGKTPQGVVDYLSTVLPQPVKDAHAALVFYLVAEAAAGRDPFGTPDAAGGLTAINFGGTLSMSFDSAGAAGDGGGQYLRVVIRPILGHLVYAAQPRTVRG